jgi:hypothetical protein
MQVSTSNVWEIHCRLVQTKNCSATNNRSIIPHGVIGIDPSLEHEVSSHQSSALKIVAHVCTVLEVQDVAPAHGYVQHTPSCALKIAVQIE